MAATRKKMSEMDVSRRALLRRIGVSVSLIATGEGILPAQDARHVHQAVAAEKTSGKGTYKPKTLTAHEYATVQRLTDLIIPADERSPGALAAGAAGFIDFLCAASDELKETYTGGVAWLDAEMRRRHGADFVAAKPDQQTALLDVLAYRKNASSKLNPGISFFSWVRNMTVDAYYTTPIGVKEIGFMGNGAMAEFTVPEAAVQYVMKKSPFA